jgi:hypothetical protein
MLRGNYGRISQLSENDARKPIQLKFSFTAKKHDQPKNKT